MFPWERDAGDFEDCDLEFTPKLFAQQIAEWVAVDNQVICLIGRISFPYTHLSHLGDECRRVSRVPQITPVS